MEIEAPTTRRLSRMDFMRQRAFLCAHGVDLPFVEIGIGLSVVILGLAVAWGFHLPTAAAMALAGVLCRVLCHLPRPCSRRGDAGIRLGSRIWGWLRAGDGNAACVRDWLWPLGRPDGRALRQSHPANHRNRHGAGGSCDFNWLLVIGAKPLTCGPMCAQASGSRIPRDSDT